MRPRHWITQARFAAFVLSVAIASGQNAEPKRQPEVPFVPTTPEAVQAMLKLAEVRKSDIVYDLDCGDGRIVIAAAKTYGAHGVGIDIDPQRIKEAKENAKKAGVENLVRFEENDLFQADIHEASVVTLFLLSSVNLRLRPKLLHDLKPGTRVVSNTFDMGDWKPSKEQTLDGTTGVEDSFFSHAFYLWIIPPNAGK
jgi:SAM-dependent methyltransferase